MLGFGKNADSGGSSVSHAMRETLFGDMSREAWVKPAEDGVGAVFVEARNFAEAGRKEESVLALHRILDMPGLEARCYLQAWHFLRAQGEKAPQDSAKKVLGVVIEVGLAEGLDLLAAYEDGSARYWNYSGAGVVWDAKGDARVDSAVRDVLHCGQFIADRIGFWVQPRRPAPVAGMVRLNMLTPGGLCFGEGPMAMFTKDALASPLLGAGIRLMQLLMQKSKASNAGNSGA